MLAPSTSRAVAKASGGQLAEEERALRSTRVWDLPVRAFHWLLAAAFIAAFALAETGDDDDSTFVLHMGLGLLVGLMAVLRLIWGLVGTEHARFSGFALSPAALFRYLRGLFGKPAPPYLGHNPASSYATLILLVLALGLAISGLLLARGSEAAEELHEFCATGFLIVSIVHVVGVTWHAIRYRDGVALAIIDGKKSGDSDRVSVARSGAAGLVFVVVIAGSAGALLAGYDSSRGTIDLPGVGWTIGGDDDHGHDHGGDDDDDDDDDDRGRRGHGHHRDDRRHDRHRGHGHDD